jgi:hypothetical protein
VFFSPGLRNGAVRRSILKQSRASFVVADCGAPTQLRTQLAPLARLVKQFGCVSVYETL